MKYIIKRLLNNQRLRDFTVNYLQDKFNVELLKYYRRAETKIPEDEFSKMQYLFTHSKTGLRYYAYKGDFDMPIKRLHFLQAILTNIAQKITPQDLTFFQKEVSDLATVALKLPANNPNKDLYLKKIITLCEFLQIRTDIGFDPATVIELLAASSIREDENPFVRDVKIHQEKVNQINDDMMEGVSDFFTKNKLTDYLPSLTQSGKKLIELLKKQEEIVAKFKSLKSGYIKTRDTKAV